MFLSKMKPKKKKNQKVQILDKKGREKKMKRKER